MSTSRRWIGALLAAVALACALMPGLALATSPPPVAAPEALLMTMDGRVLWSKNANSERRVASTIKMLNALVVMERADLDETVTVAAKAARTPSGVGLVKGQKLTVRQLLQMMLVASANDAAEAVAIHIGGTEAKYVALMNAKAKQLGLTHTHAIDPHGLSKREHSTANDLSVLARAVMADPTLRKIVAMRSVVVPRPHGKSVRVASTDKLLGHYAGIEGVKTGFTNPAGYCFVGAAKRGQVELLSVVLGTKSLNARFTETRKLLDWGFSGFRLKRVVSKDATIGIVQVSGGVVPTDAVHPARDATAAVWVRGSAVVTSITIPAVVLAPIRRGDQLGIVRAIQLGKVLATVPLLSDSAIATAPPAPMPPAPSAPSAENPSLWLRITHLPRQLWLAFSSALLWGRAAGSS